MLMVKQGLIISLQFTAFDIDHWGTTSYGCIYDHLTIMDGDGTTLMGKSCGPDIQSPSLLIGDSFLSCPDLPCAALPPNITSNSNIVKLLFSTDGSALSGTPIFIRPRYRVFFFHWASPKKLKYGKPRLGESTLT